MSSHDITFIISNHSDVERDGLQQVQRRLYVEVCNDADVLQLRLHRKVCQEYYRRIASRQSGAHLDWKRVLRVSLNQIA